MPMFGGKHYSNPKVGMMHESGAAADKVGGMSEEPPQEKAKGYSVHHHEDGTAHSHIHHADDTHEHTDHASAEEAHAHVEKAVGGEEQGETMPDDEESEAETMQPMARTFKPSTVHRANSGAF